MDLQNEKCVMVIDERLPLGIIANTAAIMGVTLGRTYDEFIEKMGTVSETELSYYGIALCGAKKKVNRLTGSMGLLR